MRLILSICFALISAFSFAQDDLEDLLGGDEDMGKLPISATFKTTRIINAHNTQMVKAKHVDFRVGHRFGVVNNGISDLFGLDNATDTRIAFEFGITDKLGLSFARNKGNDYDFYVKYLALQQTVNDKTPVSIALLSTQLLRTGPASADEFSDRNYTQFAHRLSYTNQILISRKFSDNLSLQLMPTHIYRNLTVFNDPNSVFAIGVGGRIKLTKRFALIGDYYYVMRDEQFAGINYYNPLSLGVAIETGGHVFHLNFTNSSKMNELDYMTNTTDSWTDRAAHFGFNISRVFAL